MTDIRIKKVAEILVEHSTKVKKGDKVIISATDNAKPLIKEVYKLCIKKGAYVTVKVSIHGLSYIFYKNAKKHQLEHYPKISEYEAKETDVYIAIHGNYNSKELQNIDPKKLAITSKVKDPISKIIMSKRWIGFDYPTQSLAQDAGMSLEEYEDFLYSATTQIDPEKITKKLVRIKSHLDKTTKVKIISKDTNLQFTINDMIAQARYALHNLPDGEVFTAQNKYSTNGHIKFTYPSIRGGNEIEDIYLEFKDGKVINESAKTNQKFLTAMLNTDQGSRYLGEFGIGMNDKINKFTKNLLFDEKMGGTIHLALGMAYPECTKNNKKNGNTSALHWDIVKDLKKDKVEIYFDDKLVNKHGNWFI